MEGSAAGDRPIILKRRRGGPRREGGATRRTADRLTKLPVRLLENPYAHSSDCGIERGGGGGRVTVKQILWLKTKALLP